MNSHNLYRPPFFNARAISIIDVNNLYFFAKKNQDCLAILAIVSKPVKRSFERYFSQKSDVCACVLPLPNRTLVRHFGGGRGEGVMSLKKQIKVPNLLSLFSFFSFICFLLGIKYGGFHKKMKSVNEAK